MPLDARSIAAVAALVLLVAWFFAYELREAYRVVRSTGVRPLLAIPAAILLGLLACALLGVPW